jgi:hypothetical protein
LVMDLKWCRSWHIGDLYIAFNIEVWISCLPLESVLLLIVWDIEWIIILQCHRPQQWQLQGLQTKKSADRVVSWRKLKTSAVAWAL